MDEKLEQVQETGMSRRKALAILGAGALTAAASLALRNKSAFGETVTGSVYGTPGSEASEKDVILTTIAQLRSGATAAESGKLYYVMDSGREGEFVYDAADSSALDDDGIVIVSSTGARFKRLDADVLNVRWFGAKGDNTTDDSDAIQKAIDLAEKNVGGTVYLPAGNYVVTNLKVKYHYVAIQGEGFQSSRLINRHKTNPVLDIQIPVPPGTAPSAQPTITNIEIRDLMVKNEISRPGDYPLVYASKLVGSRFHGVYFQNSTLLIGGSYYHGSGVRLIDAFEVSFYDCTFRQFQKGYGLDMPNDTVNVGNIQLSSCLFAYCGHAFLYARGAGSMANSVLLSNPKFIGWQGGYYVSQNRVRYYQTTATANVTDSDYVPVPDASKFTANEVVLVGSGTRVTPGLISSVDLIGSRIKLNKKVTILSGDTVLQGTVAVHSGYRAQELKINIGHFEGFDVGVYASNKLGLITLDGVHAGNTSNVVVIDDQVQYLSVANSRFFYKDTAKLYTNWWTVVRITKLDNNKNVIVLDNNYMSPEDAEEMIQRTVVNQTSFQPLIRITDKDSGISYKGDGIGETYHDTFYQTYNRTSTSSYTRQRWQESGTDKWLLDFRGADGNLGYSLAGQTKESLVLDGVGGHMGSGGSAWNEPHLKLGAYHLWVDGSGSLRIKNGVPASATDGQKLQFDNGPGNGPGGGGPGGPGPGSGGPGGGPGGGHGNH